MLKHFSTLDRNAFKDGMRTFAPSMPALIAWALVTGIAMSKSSLTTMQAVGMSLLVYAGSSQIAVLPLIATNSPIWTIILTATIVNCRFLIFSAGLLPHFSYHSLPRRLGISYLNADIIYFLFMQRQFGPGPVPGKTAFYLGMGVSGWFCWQIALLSGIALATLVPADWGLDFAGTLALIPLIFIALENRAAVAAVAAAGIAALLLFDLPYQLGLTISVILAIIVGSLGESFINRFTRNKNTS